MGRFEGRVAIVTGAAQGIGAAIARRLANEGAQVGVVDLTAERAQGTADEIVKAGGGALAVGADVSKTADVQAAVAAVVAEFGHVDILVNNAGITRDNLIVRMSEEDWDQVVDTNLKGTFLCIRAFTRPMMKQRYGRIVNVSSVVGLMGNAGQANYVAAKAGIVGLTKAVAKELASRHITVNAVAPGFIETAMTSALSEKVRDALKEQIPLGRLGAPEDVAHAVAFLCSEEAGYVTGQVLTVDGGMRM